MFLVPAREKHWLTSHSVVPEPDKMHSLVLGISDAGWKLLKGGTLIVKQWSVHMVDCTRRHSTLSVKDDLEIDFEKSF